MRRVLEQIAFLGLATAVHAGVLASVWTGTGGVAAVGGAQGGGPLVIEAGSAEVMAAVQRWQAPPVLADRVAAPTAMAAPDDSSPAPSPTVSDAPPAVAPTPAAPRAAPVAGETIPDLASLQAPDPLPPLAGAKTDVAAAVPDPVRPRPPSERRALRPPEAAAPSPAAVVAPVAARPASGGGDAAGRDRLRSLQAEWGAAILARIARAQQYPPGADGSGTARVSVTIGRDGRLLAVRLAASSGHAAFDRAALAAVERAGRFPQAPQALADPSYSFVVPMTFRRR